MARDQGVAFAAAIVIERILLAAGIEEPDVRIEPRRLAGHPESDHLAGSALVVEVTTASPHLLGYLVPRLQPLATTYIHKSHFLRFTTYEGH
jgi:hypothetical protein